MSLLDSISRTVKGLLNDAADTVQDPSRDARQIVRELDDSIANAISESAMPACRAENRMAMYDILPASLVTTRLDPFSQ